MAPRESIIEILDFNPIHTSHVKALMGYVREELEKRDIQQQFPLLNFYCNWLLHPEITKSPAAFDVLLEITRFICEHNRGDRPGEDL